MRVSSGVVVRVVGTLVTAVMATSPATAVAADPVVAAAGDIACDPADAAFNGGLGTATSCRQKYTSDLLLSGADAILTLGDNQYVSGRLASFQNSYALSWGRAELKAKTFPAIGNHEGTTATSAGDYCSYFGPAAHCNSSNNQGNAAFYSWDIGTWHVVAVNSNCAAAGGCDVGSPQYTWLSQDLTDHPATCTLAYWHHPRWSSGGHGSNTFMQAIWKLLYDKGAELVLSGHSHDYERFAPMAADGTLAASNGVRQFVVGTGGKNLVGLTSPALANSEVAQSNTFGVLRLTLHPAAYDFSFVSESGKPFTDSGSDVCHDAIAGTADAEPPSAPGTPTATSADVTATTVSMSWTASADNVGVTGYRVFRDGTQVGVTTGATSFQDTGLTPSTTHSYTVRAVDAAGNVSASSGALRVTTTAGGETLTFAPSDDATIDASRPTTRLGTSSRIKVDKSPLNDMLLKFTVTGTGSATSCPTIASAKLRLTVGNTTANNSTSGGDFRAGVSSAWTESTVTYNNAPRAATLTPVASIVTPVALSTAYLVDITPIITGDGTFTIRAAGRSSDGARYYSRNGNPANLAPQLQITCG